MPEYRRRYVPGGTFFFTLVTERRAPFLCQPAARALLHEAIERCRARRPFTIDAMVLLPDHLHAIWTMPPEDTDYSTRWSIIKVSFTRGWLRGGGHEQRRSASRIRNRRRGVWQRRFWEHLIRDQEDLNRHLDYVHYNPVKHDLAACPHEWPYSTFARWVSRNGYERDWQCACDGRRPKPPDFSGLVDPEFE